MEELREYLNPIYDLERLITRVAYQTASPRDLISFKNSISALQWLQVLEWNKYTFTCFLSSAFILGNINKKDKINKNIYLIFFIS